MGEVTTRWVSAGFAVVVGCALLILSRDFPSAAQEGDPGTAAFPQLAGAGLVVLGIYQATKRTTAEPFPTRAAALRVLGLLALLVAYSLMFSSIDYVLGGALFILAGLLVAGERSPITLVVVPVGVAVATAYALIVLADVPLPSGPVAELLF